MNELLGLAAGAFLASTILPGGSEALLVFVALSHTHDPWLLLAVATAANALGGMTSWGLGRFAPVAKPTTPPLQTALGRLRRFGAPLLLLSWVPVIGDPLCVAAGWVRIHWAKSLLFIAAGKGTRYAALLALVDR